jgi:hypothetical protein
VLLAPLLSGCWLATEEPVFHRGHLVELAGAYACVPRDLDRISETFHLDLEYLGHNSYDDSYSVKFQNNKTTGIAITRFISLQTNLLLAQIEIGGFAHYVYIDTESSEFFTIYGIDRQKFAADFEDLATSIRYSETLSEILLHADKKSLVDFFFSQGERIASKPLAGCYGVPRAEGAADARK